MVEPAAPPEGRRARRKQQTRDRILDSAVRLFAAQGYAGTTVDEIADTTDVARQTFFNHFRAKEDIVLAWVDRRRAEVRSGLEEASDGHAASRLGRGLQTVAALYDADAHTSRAMVRCWVQIGGPLRPDADTTAQLLRATVEAGQANAQLRPDLDADVAAHVLLDVYLGRLYRWAAVGGSLQHQLEPAVRLVLDHLSDQAAG